MVQFQLSIMSNLIYVNITQNLPFKTSNSFIIEHTKMSCSVNIDINYFVVLDKISIIEVRLRILKTSILKKTVEQL